MRVYHNVPKCDGQSSILSLGGIWYRGIKLLHLAVTVHSNILKKTKKPMIKILHRRYNDIKSSLKLGYKFRYSSYIYMLCHFFYFPHPCPLRLVVLVHQ